MKRPYVHLLEEEVSGLAFASSPQCAFYQNILNVAESSPEKPCSQHWSIWQKMAKKVESIFCAVKWFPMLSHFGLVEETNILQCYIFYCYFGLHFGEFQKHLHALTL